MYRISPSPPSNRLGIYFPFVSILQRYIYIPKNPWKSARNWDHGYPKPRKYREEPETRESFGSTARFEKVYRQHGGSCIIDPPGSCKRAPAFNSLPEILSQDYEPTDFADPFQQPRHFLSTFAYSPRYRAFRSSPIVYRRYSFSLRENHTLLKRFWISLRQKAILFRCQLKFNDSKKPWREISFVPGTKKLAKCARGIYL